MVDSLNSGQSVQHWKDGMCATATEMLFWQFILVTNYIQEYYKVHRISEEYRNDESELQTNLTLKE